MEIYGKINGVEPVKSGTSQYSGRQWQSQGFELRVTNKGKEMVLPMVAWGNTVDQLAKFNIGSLVKCYVELKGEEYQGKHYVKLECSFVEAVEV